MLCVGSKLIVALLIVCATDPPLRELDFLVEEPLPAKGTQQRERIELGKKLFFNPTLSSSGKMSCATCHVMNLELAGATRNPRDAKVDASLAPNNSPSIFNASFSFRQRWKGDGGDLEHVIDVPVVHLMYPPGKNADDIWRDIESKTKLSRTEIRGALAAYMRELKPYNSRFDMLKGQFPAGSLEEQGYARFREYGCVSCHQGIGVGGNMVAPLGAMLVDGETPTFDTYGLIEPGKIVRYKVPSLRNVGRTSPYFHNGAVQDLGDAVRFMGNAQLGRELSKSDVDAIVAFLRTLDGAPHAELLE
jgi:cytochrome c peroxidase